MAERDRPSLLDFAIAGSAAVLPVLLLVLLAVAAGSPADPALAPTAQPDRHVNVRQLAALKTFEPAIVRRREVAAGPPDAATLLARLPACRADWEGRTGLGTRLRRLFSGAGGAAASPAQRIAAQLAALDRSLAAYSGGGGNRRVSEPVGFDAGRWFDAASAALRTPVESPEYPGRAFELRCADLAAAVNALTRSEARMLDTLAWRGSVVPQVLARWRSGQFVEVSAAQVTRHNPWAGLPGCIYLFPTAGSPAAGTPAAFVGGPGSGSRRLCADAAMAGLGARADVPAPVALAGEPGPALAPDDPRWQLPPSLGTLLRPLDALRRPAGALYRAYTAPAGRDADAPSDYRYGPNRIALDGGAPVEVGFSIDLTLDPALQALAQKTAACYSGRHDVCRALGMRRRDDGARPVGHRLLEGAMVRMAAVAVVDVASGRIEALAGAMSPCTRQEFDGPGRAAGCDTRLPYPVRYRPDALLNPAVFHDAMPASVVKPILAAGFLADPEVGPRWRAAERQALKAGSAPRAGSMGAELMRSDSPRFLDRLFCADRGFADCARPAQVQRAARALGWNADCAGEGAQCGERDLLFGRGADAVAESGRVRPLARFVPQGRLLVAPAEGRPGAPFRNLPAEAPDASALAQCAAGEDGRRGTADDWEKCRAAAVVDAVAQGWGQGHARASALGVAGMMAALSAAANGQPALHPPHLVQRLRGVGRRAEDAQLEPAALRWDLARAEPPGVPREAAQLILEALSHTHRGGTAQPACEQLFAPRACRDIDWLAGKTGTPTFPNDARSLDELARLCGRRDGTAARATPLACGPLRPYKWYAAAYRPPGGGPGWTKAIAVLVERNWLADSGRIHAAGDRGPNPAAEIAMQIAARHVGVLPGAAE